MSRPRHPKKEIEEALQEIEAKGWRVEKCTGQSTHAWGRLKCPYNQQALCPSRCQITILSTPRSPWAEAKKIRKIAEKCTFYAADKESK